MAQEFFQWSEKYSVDIEEIDNQHKKLFNLINRLYNGFMQKTPDFDEDEIIKELFDYTQYHFTTEEKYFVKFNYEHKDEHVLSHITFIEKIRELKEQKSNEIKITSRLMRFLRNWLSNHIMGEDKLFQSCFKSHGL